MDTTPSPKMYEAMSKFVDSVVGEAPTDVESTTPARKRRQQRRIAMDFLHSLVRLSMREGVGRFIRERGGATVMDTVRPNPLKVEGSGSGTILGAHDA